MAEKVLFRDGALCARDISMQGDETGDNSRSAGGLVHWAREGKLRPLSIQSITIWGGGDGGNEPIVP